VTKHGTPAVPDGETLRVHLFRGTLAEVREKIQGESWA
jgi:hypothetical protein